MIYLDHNATTPVDPAVCEAVLNVLRDPSLQANPSSVHVGGQRARAVVERGRQKIARALGVGSLQVTLTSGGTEANNLAILGVARRLHAAGKPAGVVTSPLEHPSVRGAAARLRHEGLTVVEVGVTEQGHISPEQVAATVWQHPEVGLVSLALCNHELGNLFDIKNIVSAVRKTRSDVLFHTDAVQAFGKVGIDFPDLGVDLLSLSAHKVYGPKGIGALVHRRGLAIQSLFFGGHQERGRRPGTENPALAAGFGVAATRAVEHLEHRRQHVAQLRRQLVDGLKAMPEVVLNGDIAANVGNTVNFSVPECEGQLLLINLDLEGLAVSTGAACSAGTLGPSDVLLALGVSRDIARSAIRVSFGRDNTANDVRVLLEVLPRAIAKVRGTA